MLLAPNAGIQTVTPLMFGAVGDGVADDTAALQRAIDWVMYGPIVNGGLTNQPNIGRLYIPMHGYKYKITDTLQVGYGFDFRSILIEGDWKYPYQSGTILAGIIPTFNDRPAINVQGGRNVTLRRICVTGVNYQWLSANYNSITNRTAIANFYGPNVSASNNSRYAPYCGISIDAYSGPQPTPHYPNVSYPVWTGVVTQYNKATSSQVVIEECSIAGFVVGFIQQPGNVPNASNGDFVTIRDCDISFNVVNYAICNTDARNNNIYNSRLHFCYTAIDSITYGPQLGNMLSYISGSSFDDSTYVFNINLGIGAESLCPSLTLDNCYMENSYSFGTIYTTGTGYGGILFNGGQFGFSVKSSELSPAYVMDGGGVCFATFNNTDLSGGFGMFNMNCVLEANNLNISNLVQSAYIQTSPSGRLARSYSTCLFAPKSRRMNVFALNYWSYTGNNYPGNYDSEDFNPFIGAGEADGTALGVPIPWFVNQLSYNRSRYPMSNVPALVCNRVTYNLSAVSQSGNETTFTVNTGFVTDVMGDNTETPFSINNGDLMVDNTTGYMYYIKSNSISGSGGAQTITIVARQLTGIFSADGVTWVASATPATNVGNLTFHNARRFYINAKYRVLFTATNGSANTTAVKMGIETNPLTFSYTPMRANDYLISSTLSELAGESIFSRAKCSSVNVSTGAMTFSTNARRAFIGDAPLCIKGAV
jgi:hypothetical protein